MALDWKSCVISELIMSVSYDLTINLFKISYRKILSNPENYPPKVPT